MANQTIPMYRPEEIEHKWQEQWEKDGLYHADIHRNEQKFYALTMLPYPSGDLHIGHWYAMAPSDARARFKRMNGYNVLFPIGFDAFGLPAENAAIKRNIHPKPGRMPTSSGCARSSGQWARCLTGAERSSPRMRSIIAGRSGSSSNYSSMGWLTEKCHRWTGAPKTTPPWHVSRW